MPGKPSLLLFLVLLLGQETQSPGSSDRIPSLEHDKTDSTHVLGARHTSVADAAGDGCSAVVVHVEVQVAVTSSEALFFEEERVVQESKGVEDVKVGLG